MTIFHRPHLLLLLCTSALAQAPVAPSGSGTTLSPYQIDSLPNLAWIAQDSLRWNAVYLQTSDIRADSTTHWHDGAGFRPIGSSNVPFTGKYHGHGHFISGLVIRRPGAGDVGLFGTAIAATIDSLALVGDSVRGRGNVGGIAGYIAAGTKLSWCSASGVVVGDSGSFGVGGLIGTGTESILQDCSSSGNVSGGKGSQSTGGIGGILVSGTMIRGLSSASVSGHLCVGGMVGQSYNSSTILDSRSIGKVSGDDYVGGLAGTVESHSRVVNSNANGPVFGSRSSELVGGLVGALQDSSFVVHCFAQGTVWTGTLSAMVGGLVGWNNQSEIDSSYATGDVVSDTTAYQFGGLVGLSEGSLSRIWASYATGLVWGGFGSLDLGGLVGKNHSHAYIGNSYATGIVVAGEHSSNVGGLAGSGTGDCSFYSCYATGRLVVGSATTYVGGIVGYLSGLSIPTACKWDRESSETNDAFGVNPYGFASISYATNGMRSAGALYNWDPTAWAVRQDSTYPALRGLDNAPFAFPDTIAGSEIALSRLLDNDFDYETGQAHLVYRVTEIGTGWVQNGMFYFWSTVKDRDTVSLVYRVGEILPATRDTLWGNRVTCRMVYSKPSTVSPRRFSTSFAARLGHRALVLEYDLPEAADLDVTLIDLHGTRAMTFTPGRQEAGSHHWRGTLPTLPPGVYLAQLRVNGILQASRQVVGP